MSVLMLVLATLACMLKPAVAKGFIGTVTRNQSCRDVQQSYLNSNTWRWEFIGNDFFNSDGANPTKYVFYRKNPGRKHTLSWASSSKKCYVNKYNTD